MPSIAVGTTDAILTQGNEKESHTGIALGTFLFTEAPSTVRHRRGWDLTVHKHSNDNGAESESSSESSHSEFEDSDDRDECSSSSSASGIADYSRRDLVTSASWERRAKRLLNSIRNDILPSIRSTHQLRAYERRLAVTDLLGALNEMPLRKRECKRRRAALHEEGDDTVGAIPSALPEDSSSFSLTPYPSGPSTSLSSSVSPSSTATMTHDSVSALLSFATLKAFGGDVNSARRHRHQVEELLLSSSAGVSRHTYSCGTQSIRSNGNNTHSDLIILQRELIICLEASSSVKGAIAGVCRDIYALWESHSYRPVDIFEVRINNLGAREAGCLIGGDNDGALESTLDVLSGCLAVQSAWTSFHQERSEKDPLISPVSATARQVPDGAQTEELLELEPRSMSLTFVDVFSSFYDAIGARGISTESDREQIVGSSLARLQDQHTLLGGGSCGKDGSVVLRVSIPTGNSNDNSYDVVSGRSQQQLEECPPSPQQLMLPPTSTPHFLSRLRRLEALESLRTFIFESLAASELRFPQRDHSLSLAEEGAAMLQSGEGHRARSGFGVGVVGGINSAKIDGSPLKVSEREDFQAKCFNKYEEAVCAFIAHAERIISAVESYEFLSGIPFVLTDKTPQSFGATATGSIEVIRTFGGSLGSLSFAESLRNAIRLLRSE